MFGYGVVLKSVGDWVMGLKVGRRQDVTFVAMLGLGKGLKSVG